MIPFNAQFYWFAAQLDTPLIERCLRVTASCRTPEQFRTAARYAELVERRCLLGEAKAEAVNQQQYCLRRSMRVVAGGDHG